MGGGDAVARPPRDTFQNRSSSVNCEGTIVVILLLPLLLLLLLRTIKDPVKIESDFVIKASKSANIMGHSWKLIEFLIWSSV